MPVPRYQLVPGGRLVHQPAAGGVGWRLLGPNNRELGRSSLAYRDAEEALAAVAEVRRLAVEGAARILHDPATALWWWRLEERPGVVVAAAGRGFRHERACRYNLEQFRRAAPLAPCEGAATHGPP